MQFLNFTFLRKYNDEQWTECQKSHFEYYFFRKVYLGVLCFGLLNLLTEVLKFILKIIDRDTFLWYLKGILPENADQILEL